MKIKITIAIVLIAILIIYINIGNILPIYYKSNCSYFKYPEHSKIFKDELTKIGISFRIINAFGKEYILFKGNKQSFYEIDSIFNIRLNAYEEEILPKNRSFNLIPKDMILRFITELNKNKIEYKEIKYLQDKYFIVSSKDSSKANKIYYSITK